MVMLDHITRMCILRCPRVVDMMMPGHITRMCILMLSYSDNKVDQASLHISGTLNSKFFACASSV